MIPTAHDIASAYRMFLNREPDGPGMCSHLESLAEGGLTMARLRDTFLRSEEYRALRRERLQAVDVGGATMYVDPEEPEFGRHIARYGSWEPHIQDVLRRVLRPGDTVVDIGANVGVMTLRAASLVGASGQVIAIEPDLQNYQTLLWNIHANQFSNIIAMQLAVSDRSGVIAMTGNSNGSVVPIEDGESLMQALPGDLALAHLNRLDLVKIDIEGHEPEALSGLRQLIGKFRPALLVEYNPLRLGGISSPRAQGLAAALFRGARMVTAICDDGSEAPLADPAAMIALWHQCNKRMAESGRLPDGMVHFDVLVAC
jgi:FkbM family methyltransferase